MTDIDPTNSGLPEGWYQTYSNIITLTAWMADQHFPASEVARAVEKPWSYADEYALALADQARDEAEDIEHMHRRPHESYMAMLIRNRQATMLMRGAQSD